MSELLGPAVVLVGGDFGDTPKESGVARHIFASFMRQLIETEEKIPTIQLYNGGTENDLSCASLSARTADVVLWFPNVSNDVDKKYITTIKATNPKCILVASKRRRDDMTFADVIQHMLKIHANLCVEFDKCPARFTARLADPLGNIYCQDTNDLQTVGRLLARRVKFLRGVTRMGSIHQGLTCEVPDEPEFFEFVRNVAGEFAKLIPSPKQVDRFVGNASFRCTRGFPSFRGPNNVVYVSRRNVEKESITREAFVPVTLGDNELRFRGAQKPSTDAPVQALLYNLLPNIRYMIHGHVYSPDAVGATNEVYPCGALEEVKGVMRLLPDWWTPVFVVNLKGHGFIAGSEDVDNLKSLRFCSRDIPEQQEG